MSLWKNIRNALFGSGGDTDRGMYFYIQLYNIPQQPGPDDEIVKVRLDPQNDLSWTESGNYFVRKAVVGTHKFKRGELILYFNGQKKLTDHEVNGGELVDQAAYEAFMEKVQG
jgi:hypothetical protein